MKITIITLCAGCGKDQLFVLVRFIFPSFPFKMNPIVFCNKKPNSLLAEPSVTHVKLLIPLADPGFGQGGAPRIFFRDFADVARWSRVSEVSQYWP